MTDVLPHQLAEPRTDHALAFSVPGPLPGMNEIVGSLTGHYGRYKYNSLKKKWHRIIGQSLIAHRISRQTEGRWFFEFTWVEKARRRDPDNIPVGGRKFILDSLVECEILVKDGHRHVAGWTDRFEFDKTRAGAVVKMSRVG